jgi:hypothetical protein
VLDLHEPMRPDLLETLDMLLVRIGHGHAQDLEVEPLVVAHLQPADRPSPDAAAWERRLVDQEQSVRVVAVTGPGTLDEPVVEVVVNGRSQNAIQAEDAGGFVVLVLVATAPRDLDHDLDDVGKLLGVARHPALERLGLERSRRGATVGARENARRNLGSVAMPGLACLDVISAGRVLDRRSNQIRTVKLGPDQTGGAAGIAPRLA